MATVSGLSATSYAQVEQIPLATSPILTYGAAVTVPADNWRFTGAALARIKSGAACVAIEFQTEPGAGATGRVFDADDGTTSNRIDVSISSSGVTPFIVNNGVQVSGVVNAGDASTAKRRMVISWSGALIIQGYDSATPQTFSSAIPPVTQAILGNVGWGSRPAYGWFSQIMIRQNCTAAQVRRYSTAGANLRGN